MKATDNNMNIFYTFMPEVSKQEKNMLNRYHAYSRHYFANPLLIWVGNFTGVKAMRNTAGLV